MKQFKKFFGWAFVKLKSLIIKQKPQKELTHKSFGKKLSKKLNTKLRKTQQKKPKTLMEKTFEQVDMLLKNYENFVKKDFIMILHEANAMLRSWKSNIVNSLAQNPNRSINEIDNFSNDLNEINQIYTQSEITLHNMINHCQEYQTIVANSKRLVSPQQKLTQIQVQLEGVIKTLRRGLEMTDIERNSDYKYLSNYLQKSTELAISR